MRFSSSASAAVAAVVLVISGCSSGPVSPQQGLASARTRWSARAPASYDMVIEKSCECVPGASGAVWIAVRNGATVSRTYLNGGEPVPAQFAGAFPSVPELFEVIDQAIRAGTRPLDLKYDPVLGYPRRAALGDPAADAPLYVITELTAR
jgi:hypothetical protein